MTPSPTPTPRRAREVLDRLASFARLERTVGDGYGVVLVEGSQLVINPARKVTRYSDGSRMEMWRQKVLSAPSVNLIDGGVRVPPHAIKRIISPLDCPEAARIRMRRYTKNWGEHAFVNLATDAEIVAAMSHTDERQTYAACVALQQHYSREE